LHRACNCMNVRAKLQSFFAKLTEIAPNGITHGGNFRSSAAPAWTGTGWECLQARRVHGSGLWTLRRVDGDKWFENGTCNCCQKLLASHTHACHAHTTSKCCFVRQPASVAAAVDIGQKVCLWQVTYRQQVQKGRTFLRHILRSARYERRRSTSFRAWKRLPGRNLNGHISATNHLIHFWFGFIVE